MPVTSITEKILKPVIGALNFGNVSNFSNVSKVNTQLGLKNSTPT